MQWLFTGCIFTVVHRGFVMEDFAGGEERERRYYRWRRYLPWCKVFAVSLMAGVLTTSIGVLIVSLVFKEYLRPNRDSGASESSNTTATDTSPVTGSTPDITFQFLCPLNQTKEHVFQGGSVQCATYRKNSSTYSSAEEMAFGQTLNYFNSEISVCTLAIKSGGLRIPHWNLISNAHGLVIEGNVWVGVIDVGSTTAVTYNASVADVLFFPRNRPYWIKNNGNITSFIVLFFSTSEEPFSLEVNDVFFSTPEDILARTLLGFGGIPCIRTIVRPKGDNVISLPSNLAELMYNATYPQSANALVWKYSYNLPGARQLIYQGGLSQWARCYLNMKTLANRTATFSASLLSHPNTLGLQVLRLNSSGFVTPHSNTNANGMGYVIRGCGQAGVVGSVVADFSISAGNVIFFPIGMSYYIRSTCDVDLILVLAYSTCGKLQTLYMDDYIHAFRGTVLAQLFGKKETCLDRITDPRHNVTIRDSAGDKSLNMKEETTDHISFTADSDAVNSFSGITNILY